MDDGGVFSFSLKNILGFSQDLIYGLCVPVFGLVSVRSVPLC